MNTIKWEYILRYIHIYTFILYTFIHLSADLNGNFQIVKIYIYMNTIKWEYILRYLH
jgi:hypothetical protein